MVPHAAVLVAGFDTTHWLAGLETNDRLGHLECHNSKRERMDHLDFVHDLLLSDAERDPAVTRENCSEHLESD